MPRYLNLLAVCAGLTAQALAQSPATINGQATDPSGQSVAEASVTLSRAGTRSSFQTSTDANGSFTFNNVAAGTYSLRAFKAGFEVYEHSLVVAAGQRVTATIPLSLSAVQQTVVVNGGSVPGATPQPSESDVFNSDQTLRVLDRTQMDMLGPIAGAAQVVALTPGALVTGYGNSGAQKYTISVNGINQGWGGYGGYTAGASLAITFDGVPIMDPATGLWQSATIPQMQLIQNTVVTYGPGDPINRWYTNVGGAVEFTPLQPGDQFHGDLLLSYGSYNQKNLQFDVSTPEYKGWSAIFAGGGGQGNDFRIGPDGFGSPSKDLAAYGKTIKSFKQSSVSLGAYYAHSGGYRSQVIPVTAQPGITLDGTPTGALYSQATSGFYSTLPYANYNKYDTNEMGIVYGKENLHIDDNTQIQNMTWFVHIRRLHDRLADVYNPGPQVYEWNNPHTDTYGDQFTVTRALPGNNLLSFGGYFLHALYNTRNNFYNPLDGGSYNTANVGGKVRSGYFNQNNQAIALQDNFKPISKLSITAGIRWARFTTSYFDNALQDFNLGPGATLSSHCSFTLTSAPGTVKDQGSNCPNYQARYGFEPSISVSYRALNWLTFYGGYLESLRSPSLGGGGGLFQAVDPYSYHLSRARYGQFGFKIHQEGVGMLNNLIWGANLYRVDYTSQEIDIGLSNGDTIAANGAARYQGLNYFADADPTQRLHLFMNGNLEGAHYTEYNVGGLAYNGSPVPYVPSSTFNIGATYHFNLTNAISIIPVGAFQFAGSQHIFDNTVGAPSNQSLAGYGTVNLGVTAPFKHFDLMVNALNVLNRKYNEYLWISSGGYFGTSYNGYELAYPGAPFTIYGSVRLHF